MRRRFHLTIFFVLVAVAITAVAIHSHDLRNHHLEQLDLEAQRAAQGILISGINNPTEIDANGADKILSDELGTERSGKFFVIRDGKNQIIYENVSNYNLAPSSVPSKPQWVTINDGDMLIRVLNLDLPNVKDRTLQVGVVVDKDLVAPHFEASSLLLIVAIFGIGFFVSFLVSKFLMKPIKELESFFTGAISTTGSYLPTLPTKFLTGGKRSSIDEFKRLAFGLNELILKVNRTHKSSRQWSHQMAHELKTPLMGLQMQVEKIQKQNPSIETQHLKEEIERIKNTVNSFLSWAELDNSVRKNLFAANVENELKAEAARYCELYRNRLIIQNLKNPTVMCDPAHLRQLLFNLILNSLQNSSDEKQVTVKLNDSNLQILDSGPGFPKQVLERLGEPFNKTGKQSPNSHGLGLAWVSTICRIYDWNLRIESTSAGSVVTVEFEKSALV